MPVITESLSCTLTLWGCHVALLVTCLLSHHGGVGRGCPHYHDVGVVCTNEDLPGEGEWMWVSRRECQCTVNLIQWSNAFLPQKGFVTCKTYQTINARWGQRHIIRGCQGHAWHDKSVTKLCINARGSTTTDYTRVLGAHITWEMRRWGWSHPSESHLSCSMY